MTASEALDRARRATRRARNAVADVLMSALLQAILFASDRGPEAPPDDGLCHYPDGHDADRRACGVLGGGCAIWDADVTCPRCRKECGLS